MIYQGKRGWYKPSLSLYWYDKNPTTKYVTTNNVNFRTAEKWDSPVAQSKKAGESVLVLRKMPKSGWLEVVLTNSVIGYIPDSPNYVKNLKKSTTIIVSIVVLFFVLLNKNLNHQMKE
ncbi:Uncharacterised protein [Listeria fleischmannii subsp. fleischmannii]|uniref:SH3b domain-containing protein n=1 Tax=Listeria fleischmannii subsp. fleischmannii TaxID=1671902 RepID=A0A2X3IUT8_9LIST|nr:hypothetical protein [Listeria fleischmannii]SQC65370.1 Uncharacterised protein [Listeria fleischmannii subsp. fleischmannii]